MQQQVEEELGEQEDKVDLQLVEQEE